MFRSSPFMDSAAVACRVAVDDSFRNARRLGAVLIGLQALILGYLSGARLFPAVILILAGIVGTLRYRLHLERITVQLLGTLLAIGFLLYFSVFPYPVPIESQFLRTELAHTVARYLICLQLLTLVACSEPHRPPLWLAGLSAFCLPFAANIRVPPVVQQVLVLWIVVFVAVLALYSSTARRKVAREAGGSSTRTLILTVALAVVMVLGGGFAVALQRHERNIEWFLRDYLGYGSQFNQLGFSPSGRLNDVINGKTIQSERVALRVYSAEEPGYLRGKAFDTYHNPNWEKSWRAWSTDSPMRKLTPIEPPRGLPRTRTGKLVYELDGPHRGPWRTLEVWPEVRLGTYVMAPLGTAYLTTSETRVTADIHQTLMGDEREHRLPYSVVHSPAELQRPLTDELRGLLTSLDPEIDPYVSELARQIFAGCRTAREKIDRVQKWFRSNFQYELGVQIPRGEDPVIYFLKFRPPAHCELFATGTAVLLRTAGVPCRYVTGYVVAEENAVGGYWIARNKDAHAWVEAYDLENENWVIVESTPAAGVPLRRTERVGTQLADSLRQRWRMIRSMLDAERLTGGLKHLASRLWSIPALVTLLVMVSLALLWKRPVLSLNARALPDRRLTELHAILSQLDRRAKPLGLHRPANETLAQFAHRIRRADGDTAIRNELADCYDLYATVRFRGQTGPDALAELRRALSGLSRHASSRSAG